MSVSPPGRSQAQRGGARRRGGDAPPVLASVAPVILGTAPPWRVYTAESPGRRPTRDGVGAAMGGGGGRDTGTHGTGTRRRLRQEP